ncbi:MAG: SDR family NAD(P)-dependent oxidoreductase, partial [Verrucomicrobiota bacterium]
SQKKSESQVAELRESHPDQSFTYHTADLMDLAEVSQVTEEISRENPEIDAVYNIAGILTDKRLTSSQGVEGHFAVNVLAPYLILQKLRSNLVPAAGTNHKPVVVNFSSSAIKSVKSLDVSKLKNPDEIGGLMGAYAKSKLAVTMMAEMMERELEKDEILIYSVDPGPTKTSMTGGTDGMPLFIRLLRPLLFKSAESQAIKLVDAVQAGVNEGETGLYLSEGKRKTVPPITYNVELQESLRRLLEEEIREFL